MSLSLPKVSRPSLARRIFVGSLLVSVVALPCLYMARKRLKKAVVSRVVAAPPSSLLCVGVDDSGNLADFVGVFYFSEIGESPRLLIVPRDSLTEGGHKLNGRWQTDGPAAFQKRIEKIVGQKIDGRLAIPFQQLPALLTQAFPDGLSVPVPYRLLYADSSGGFSYDIPAGRQVLNPTQLKAFLRDRYSDPKARGEAARVDNWRRFLIETRKELSKPTNWGRLQGLAASTRGILQTDLSQQKLTSVFTAFVMAPDFSTCYLPSKSEKVNGKWQTIIDLKGARRQTELAKKGVAIPSETRAWVLNGTETAGKSLPTALQLQDNFGLRVSRGNAPQLTKRSIVEYSRPELEPLAREVAADLDGAQTRLAHDKARMPLIVVTIGG